MALHTIQENSIRTVIEWGRHTDVGRVRSQNEDSMGIWLPDDKRLLDERGYFFMVADGMGGHKAGDVASHMAVDHATRMYYQGAFNGDPALCLEEAVKAANLAIHEESNANAEHHRMGTTFVGLVIFGPNAYVANVGDSRCYRIRNNQLEQVTKDHSWVAMQVGMGLMTEEEAEASENRNILVRCMGEKPDVIVDIDVLPLERGDIFLMCSDGLHGMVPRDEIRLRCTQMRAQTAAESLVELANARGGHDNITVQIVKIHRISGHESPYRDLLPPVPPMVQPPPPQATGN